MSYRLVVGVNEGGGGGGAGAGKKSTSSRLLTLLSSRLNKGRYYGN